MKKNVFFIVFSIIASGTLFGQYKSKYPEIPIIDVHSHPTTVSDVSNYLKVSETIKGKYGSNLAFWIGLEKLVDPLAEMKTANSRIHFTVCERRPQEGLTYTPEEVVAMLHNGYVGMKFWFGDPRRILEGKEGITRYDDPRFENLFLALERENVPVTSQIADPNGPFDNRQNWMKDPVYYWRQIRAFENVVAKYPNLTIIAAHAAWIICQDAQIDYLRYMFSKYPNFYVDISATCQFIPLVNRDNLRDFYIEYQDRLLFGTDGGNVADNAINNIADSYARFFAILETDQIVNGGYFGNRPTQGLDLPREVLEKIYYKNALKLYPGLKTAMGL